MDEAVECNLGISTIHLEGRMLDTSGYDQDEFNSRLMAFVDRCIASKNAA